MGLGAEQSFTFDQHGESMDIDIKSKALANPLRRQILQWLKKSRAVLQIQACGGSFERGVCAGHIERL